MAVTAETLLVAPGAPLAALDPDTYVAHPLHDDARDWPETNCYVDLWIEVLHALGLNPVAALAFTLSSDFDGEQWQFFKFPPEDLRSLFGIEVQELNVWRPLPMHIEEHLRLGHLVTVEADSWFLPDTTGASYRLGHQKSTIAPARIDRDRHVLGYFHNRGYYELEGEDYDGVVRPDSGGVNDGVLPPYAEVVVLDRLRRPDDGALRTAAAELLAEHLARRPATNPVVRLTERIGADIEWLRDEDRELFHAYAFGTLRQCGAWAGCVAAFVDWFAPAESECRDAFVALSTVAKTAQFKLARAAAGRSTDLSETFSAMASHWDDGYRCLLHAHG